MSFSSLGLSPELLRAVADQGYEIPTPVQLAAIPLVLEGRDLLAGAQTGTGKTAAFVLPIIHRLHETRRDGTGRHAVRVLVVVPTRELAIQVEESVRTYGAHRPVRSATVYGGVGFGPQVSKLRAGPEVVVATPGRLLDHLGQGTIDLSKVEVLVLDEADRMLDMGFIRDIRKILAVLPPRRQNLLFSATFSDDIRELASSFLHDPANVQVTPRNTTAPLVDQLVIPVDRERKRDLLRELVALGRVRQALVFTRTKHGANRLAEQLRRDGIEAAAIHGNRSQSQRVKALDDFKSGRATMLVATDIAARGLDIEQLPHVVNFELPMVAEDYVHRIGRTGRAGETGQAISLVCVDEAPLLRAIQGMMKREITTEVIPGFEPDRHVRPEPIRLRSTPAERRELVAVRAERLAVGGRGRPATAARPAPPIRSAAPTRAGNPLHNPLHAQPERGPAPARPGDPVRNPDMARRQDPVRNARPAREERIADVAHGAAGGRRRRPDARGGRGGRDARGGAPGTGFGNAAPGGPGRPRGIEGTNQRGSRPDGGAHPGGHRAPHQGPSGAARPDGRPRGDASPAHQGPRHAGRPFAPGGDRRGPGAGTGPDRGGPGRDGRSPANGGAVRSLPGERLRGQG